MMKKNKIETPRSRLLWGILFQFQYIVFYTWIGINIEKTGCAFVVLYLPPLLAVIYKLLSYRNYKKYYNYICSDELAKPIAFVDFIGDDKSDQIIKAIIKDNARFKRNDLISRISIIISNILIFVYYLSYIKPDLSISLGILNFPIIGAIIYLGLAYILSKTIMIHNDEDNTKTRQIFASTIISMIWISFVIVVFVYSDLYLIVGLMILLTIFASVYFFRNIWCEVVPEQIYIDKSTHVRVGELEPIFESVDDIELEWD